MTLVELGGYGDHAGPRPTLPGELPPAIGMASFVAADIDRVVERAVGAEARVVAHRVTAVHPPYRGRASILLRAPGGELFELVQDSSSLKVLMKV